ncbi:MAG: SAM-dependent methyltransferase, partial [Candidatus Ornithomonoglobus sp.]
MKIYVVGLGPGGKEDMTLRAIHAIENADVVAGYDYYIELIRDMTGGKEIFSSAMKKEVDRC